MINKKHLLTLFTFIFIITSCNNDKKTNPNASKEIVSEKKFVPELGYEMIPSTEVLPTLSSSYIKIKKNEIDDFLKKNWIDKFENVSFLVAQNGQIIYEKYEGFANKEKNILNSAETPLHIASMTKVFTASVILKLIEANKLSLDQKLTTIFEGFPYKNVTIRTLLNHRSGIKKYGYLCDDKKIWDKSKTLTNADIFRILMTKKLPLDNPTNTHFCYCNTNYVLLALIIEKITGMSYSDAMSKIIFQPLGMKDTFVFDDKSPIDKGTPSYKSDYEKIPFDFLDAVYGDKNIYSTPRDVLKFDNARNAPNFLPKELLDQVFKGYSYENKGIRNYGLGIRMQEWETGQKLFYHNGWWHGNTSCYFTLKKEKAVIIALSNKFTRKTYQLKRLSVLFGDYPFKLEDDVKEE